jgi:hypothetical protein
MGVLTRCNWFALDVRNLSACLGSVDTCRRGHGIGGQVTTLATSLQSVTLPPRAKKTRFFGFLDYFEH